MKIKNMMIPATMVALAVFGLMNCGGRTTVPTNGDSPGGYPMPTLEEQASEWLKDELMSDNGRAMTGRQLATLKDEQPRSVALPVSDEDVLPRMGTYTDPKTGGTITFMPYRKPFEELKDTLNPVALVAMRTVTHEWENRACVPDKADTVSVQNRGAGILSLYRIVHSNGPNGGKHRCYDKHPDGYPEYWGILMSVYPGADSLVMTVGYEKSKRTYYYQKAE